MLRSRWTLSTLAVLALACSAFGQDNVDLKWKLEKGKPFYQETRTDTTQNMTIMGMKIEQKQVQTFYFSWTPVSEKNGAWEVKQKIEALKMDLQIGGNPLSFDSTKDTGASNNPVSDFFKKLVGAELTLTIGPDMKVTKIEGRDKLLKELTPGTNQQMEGLIKQILSEDSLKQMTDPIFAVVPDKAVKKGGTWEKTTTVNMGPIGTYQNTYKFTDKGADRDVEKIEADITVKYSPPGAGQAGGLPFKILNADLKSSDSKGTIQFDTKKGRVTNLDQTIKLGGKLNLEISGMPSEVELTQTQTTTVKITDDNPIKKEEPAKKEEKKDESKKQ